MIYTIISTVNKNKIEENRDCRILRQPLSLLPKELDEFVSNTKNDELRAERYLAYTTLLCGLDIFFGIDNATVKKNSDGKPYLIFDSKKYQKNEDESTLNDGNQKNEEYVIKALQEKENTDVEPKIYINISHSEGAVAVSMSDEGEIGVDIQSEIPEEKVERLGNRFFGDVEVKNENINVKYYYCNISDGTADFMKISLQDADKNSYTAKWAYSESLMKLYGRGFGDSSIVCDLASKSKSEIKSYNNGAWVVSTSVKNDY